nr:P-type conjugative transfer protein TrbL [uncultured Desulfobulbus sp.]
MIKKDFSRISIPLFFIGTVLLVMISSSQCCYADTDNVVYNILNKFSTKASSYGSALQVCAERLFYWCLVLDVVFLGIRVSLKRDEIALTLKQFVFMLLFAGFVFSVIKNYSVWSMNLINGLRTLANSLGGPDITLDAFKIGVNIIKQIVDKTSAWSPIDSLGYLILGCIIMACFALMAAQIVLIKCEAYVAMNASILLLGFGGSSFLKEYAINTMRYALSVAFKLFVLQLVLGIGLSFITEFETTDAQLYDLLILIGASVVLLALVKTIPDVCAGIINGTHTGNGGALHSTGAMVAGASAAVGAAVGSSLVASGRGASSTKAALDMAGYEGKTGWSKAGAAAKNVLNANSAARRERNAWGSIGQRMNSHLKDGRDASKLQEELSSSIASTAKPPPPPDSEPTEEPSGN